MGLHVYSGGLIIGRIFASEICGAYFREGLFLGGLIIGILWYLHNNNKLLKNIILHNNNKLFISISIYTAPTFLKYARGTLPVRTFSHERIHE